MNINELIGKVLIKININENKTVIVFETEGEPYKMFHDQDCCEDVYIEDIIGNLEDLINTPIIIAEETTSNENPKDIVKEHQDSFTWTFYKLATIKGYVTIRWYGESNGYYSESVEFEKIENKLKM